MRGVTEHTGELITELIREAVALRASLVLNGRIGCTDWETHRSEFLGFDRETNEPVVAAPFLAEFSGGGDEIVGRLVGASFRRGHRRYAFEAGVTGCCRVSDGREPERVGIRLAWPESVLELQRRLYYRTRVPRGLSVPAEAWIRQASDSGQPATMRGSGTLDDISAAGVSLLVTGESAASWPISCEMGFALRPRRDEPSQEFQGRLCHNAPTPDGRVRLGLELAGLDTASSSRRSFLQILHLVNSFQQIEVARLESASASPGRA